MKKHEVLVKVEVASADGSVKPAPEGTQVTFRILAQGAKVRDYHEQTDAQGRALFPLIPSNPEVQGMITYEVLADYQGVRFPFELEGVPSTSDQGVARQGMSLEERVAQDVWPESQLTLTLLEPAQGLEGVSLHHGVIELHPDEESLLVIHEMTLRNTSNKLLDLSHQPQGGLKLPAPTGAKKPELHQQHAEDLEVRGTDLYVTGALMPKGEKQIKWYYTLPYRQDTFEWSQAMPVPTTLGIVVAPRYKKPQHQQLFPLSLEVMNGLGEMREVSTGPGRTFHSLRLNRELKAGEPLTFRVLGMPAPPRWKRYALLIGSLLVGLFVLLIGSREGDTSDQVSRDQMMIERDRLLKALARMELALKRGRITPQRYQREREAITARLVTIYRALERVEQQA
jgi:hypothetical protein